MQGKSKMYVFSLYQTSAWQITLIEIQNLYTVTSTRVKYLLFPILLGVKAHSGKVRPATDRCYPHMEYELQLPGAWIESDSDLSLPNRPAAFWQTVFSRSHFKNPAGVCETQERHWFSITSPNDLALAWSTLSLRAAAKGPNCEPHSTERRDE